MKKTSKRIILAITMIMVMVLLPVFGMKLTEAKTKVKVSSVTITQPTKKSLTVKVGSTYQLKVKVAPSKATNKSVSYMSSNSKIVVVSNSGKLTAKSKGTAKITVTARDGSGKKAVLTVNSVVPVNKVTIVNPTEDSIVLTKGKTYTVKASVAPTNANNKGLSYSSSNTKVATVDGNGKVIGKNNGKTVITVKAKDGSGKLDTVNVVIGYPVTGISVNPNSITKAVGTNYKVNAVITPSNASIKAIRYSSSNTALATVDKYGNVALKKTGTVAISVYATDGSGKKATLTINIITPVKSVTLPETKVTKNVGTNYQMVPTVMPSNATNKKLTYTSSSTSLATVDTNGKVSLLKAGVVTITAAAVDGSGVKATVTITIVTPVKTINIAETNVTKNVGSNYQVVASVLPTDATNKKLTYTSSNTTVATVDASGKVSLLKTGVVKITVAAADGSGLKATCTITIIDAGYSLKWQDNFNGTKLNTADWNYELHEPGWVNNELQKYTDSEENTFVKDGSLVIKAVKKVDKDGNVSYTSGRVNTQGKHDFKYGRFEARIKSPSGKGFLPAYWMMPTDENLYGQWPKCGEVDIMEVLGDKTNKAYGTLHFGEPHTQKQGSLTLENGDFASEYHVYACEWEPSEIRFYIDGILYNTVKDWFSKKPGFGEVTYPAPFDQPFYMILNLAVGGSWPGNPDATTQFGENAELKVDYVKVYQKDSYNENVEKPTSEVTLRDPDATGNYINNGNFSVKESLTDKKNWDFLLAGTGVATADITNNELVIITTDAGELDYSVQVVQPDLPMKKGKRYRLTFDASAAENRTMITDISAPDNGYIRYMPNTITNLTTEKKSYTYDFDMLNNSDPNGRVEFNLGNQGSTAQVKISNVRLEMIGDAVTPPETKSVLPDGNYVYNGAFQEGINRLAYWNIDNKCNGAEVSVTNVNNIRELKAVVPNGVTGLDQVVLKQDPIAISGGKTYILTFDAYGDNAQTIQTTVAGKTFDTTLTATKKSYKYTFTTEDGLSGSDLKFLLGVAGTAYIDNVRIQEDALLINGDFSNGLTGFEAFTDSSVSSKVTYTVDSQKEDNAALFDINDTGDAEWKIQLKQNNIKLEQGKWYKISFDAKSSMNRSIMYALQRDGSSDNDWTPYSGSNKISITSSYQNFSKVFKMTSTTDPRTIFSISMGAVDGIRIQDSHQVFIDNIKLVEVEAPPVDTVEVGTDLIKNGDFSKAEESWTNAVTAPGAATADFTQGKAVYQITNPGSADWNVQLKQGGLLLESGSTYKVKFKVKSTQARTIKLALLTATYDYYGGADIALNAGEELSFEQDITISKDTNTAIDFIISMGKLENVDTPASNIEISDISFVKTK